MSRAALVAWGIFVLSALVMITALVLWAVRAKQPWTADIILYPATYLAFGAVGALVVSRQPSNRIGQLGLLTGASGTFVGLADTWARVAEPVPGQDWAAWVASWGFPATLAPPLLLILLFPTGRLASRRWRVVATLVIVGTVLVAVGNALTPSMAEYPSRHNPLGVEWFIGSPLESGGAGWLPLLAGAVASALGLIPRLWRARGVEREQLKWITYAAALQGSAWIFLAFDPPGVAGLIGKYAVIATLGLIPIAAGIAILRYRLYDIDVVIRRTVVYGALVTILGGLYVALVLGLQTVLSQFSGGDTIPVALSTLAIAALFGPVRGRVRDLVDRRFYRSRYDHERMVKSFGSRLRDEVDLEAVGRTLVDLADQSVRPASVGLWVRGRG